jgi:hypothetical protein
MDKLRVSPIRAEKTRESGIQLLFAAGLRLVYFDEPTPIGGEATKAERYRRSPYFHIMEWQKP